MALKLALRELKLPNDSEIYEYLNYLKRYKNYVLPKITHHNINKMLLKLIKEKIVVNRDVETKYFYKRYCIASERSCPYLEPLILRFYEIDELKKYFNNFRINKKIKIENDIYLIKDPLRDIIFAIRNRLLLGIIDFREYDRGIIRFPLSFRKPRRYNSKFNKSMTELQYFSRITSELNNNNFQWLQIAYH